MTMIDGRRVAVLALHWQVNVIKPNGFFGPMLAQPVAGSGVIERAARFHAAMRAAGVPVVCTRFTIPPDGGQLVPNTDFMRAVADARDRFHPDSDGARLINEIGTPDHVVDNQKLSGLAGNALPAWLAERAVDTVFVTGVATNLTVEQTARHGTDIGLTVYPVSDCVAAITDEVHQASLANLDLTTAGCRTADQAIALLA